VGLETDFTFENGTCAEGYDITEDGQVCIGGDSENCNDNSAVINLSVTVTEVGMDQYSVMSMLHLLAVELHTVVVMIKMIIHQITAINSTKKR
jgi:hypothetical protein